MRLKTLRFGIQFESEATAEKPLDLDEATIKAMREAARQLGLEFVAEQESGSYVSGPPAHRPPQSARVSPIT